MKATDDGRILVAGGNINYFDVTFHEGTVMQYDCNSQKWLNFPEDTIKKDRLKSVFFTNYSKIIIKLFVEVFL